MASIAWYPAAGRPGLSAHERLKESFSSYVWIAITISAVAHFLVLALTQVDASLDLRGSYGTPLEQLTLEQPIEIPPPPQAIPRPAVPVLSTRIDIDPGITITSVLFRDNPIEALPPPKLPEVSDLTAQPSFTPYEVKPELRNSAELRRILEARYPRMYREAGMSGVSLLWVFIDEAGIVRRTQVVQSSGYEELDQIAQDVMREHARFSPAYNRDVRVPVWIQIPVSFLIATG
jgi:TonB family protein